MQAIHPCPKCGRPTTQGQDCSVCDGSGSVDQPPATPGSTDPIESTVRLVWLSVWAAFWGVLAVASVFGSGFGAILSLLLSAYLCTLCVLKVRRHLSAR